MNCGVLTKDRLQNCGFCGEGVEIVVEAVVDPQRQIHHFHGLGDHLRAATEPREKMTNVAVVLFDGDGQVFAGEELALRNEAVITLPNVSFCSIARILGASSASDVAVLNWARDEARKLPEPSTQAEGVVVTFDETAGTAKVALNVTHNSILHMIRSAAALAVNLAHGGPLFRSPPRVCR